MGAIDQVVKVTITQNTQAVAQASFSALLILGPTKSSTWGSDVVRTYYQAADLLQDGFTTSSPEYVRAAAIFAQDTTPTLFKVGQRSGQSAAQVDKLSVGTFTVGTPLTLSVNSQSVSYTPVQADTQQSILGSLNTALSAAAPVSGAVTGTGSAAVLTLTGTQSGQTLVYVTGTGLAITPVSAAAGIAADLAKVAAQDNSFYGVILAGASDTEILQAASWVEANKKLCLAITSTAAAATSATTDVCSQAQAAGFSRTGILFKADGIGGGGDAAWLGRMLPTTPGSANWALKTLNGITADTLSANQLSVLIGSPVAGTTGKCANVYTNLGGVNCTQMGMAANGRYFDLTHGLDWLQSTIQTNVYAILAGTPKVPYTDVGCDLLKSGVRAAIDQGASNGLIDPASPISVTAPSVLGVSKNQRAQRIAPTISFSCRLQGALNALNIQGTVSV